jgi:endonuclease YncB( thermonuclease family)
MALQPSGFRHSTKLLWVGATARYTAPRMAPVLTDGTVGRDIGPGTTLGVLMLAASLLFALSAHAAETYTARVVSVTDGDTFKALHDGLTIVVRLRWIDAPEKGQGFSDQAARALSDLIAGQTVTVRDYGADLHRRRLADVTLEDGRQVNRELVRLGWAWWFRKYTKDIALRTL